MDGLSSNLVADEIHCEHEKFTFGHRCGSPNYPIKAADADPVKPDVGCRC